MAFVDKLEGLLVGAAGKKRTIASRLSERPDVRLPSPGMIADSEVQGLYGWYEDRTAVSRQLTQRYVDYETMDESDVFSSALDTYSDESTQPDQMQRRAVWFSSPSDDVTKRGNDLLTRLKLEDDVWGLSRGVSKYGNEFAELLLGENGVEGIKYLGAPTVRAVAEKDEILGYVQDDTGMFNITPQDFREALGKGQYSSGSMVLFQPFEIVHFKLLMRKMRALYGLGVGEPVRWLHKRVTMLEDAAVLYKLVRTPVRMAHYIDTGDIPADKKLSYVELVRNKNRRKKYKSPDGKVQYDFNPMNPLEEYWLPTGGARGDTRLEVISGSDYQAMELLEYFQAKYHNALKVPRFHLGGNDQPASSNLSSQDVRFARAVLRVQKGIKSGLEYVYGIDMMARNEDPASVEFHADMTVPSAIFELARIEVWNARADLMTRLMEFVPLSWMLTNVLMLSEKEADRLMKLKKKEDREKGVWEAGTMAKSNELTMPPMPADLGGGGAPGEEEVQALALPVTRRDYERVSQADMRRLDEKLAVLLSKDVAMARRLERLREVVGELASRRQGR